MIFSSWKVLNYIVLVNLTVKMNATKRYSKQAKMERYFLYWVSYLLPLNSAQSMRAQTHVGERTHNPLPPMESHVRTYCSQTTDKQQRTTNHIALVSRQVGSLVSNDVFNIDAPAI